MKIVLALVVAIVLAVALYLGYARWKVEQALSGPAKEIVSESMTKTGDTWHVSFVSKFAAPVDRVYEAFTHPERAHDLAPESFLKSDVVKAEDDTKLLDLIVRLDILPPGFKVQTLQLDYHFFPAEHRITSQTVGSKLADIAATYQLEPTPDGQGTILRFTETSKDKGGIPIEDVQKGALREIYLTQVRLVNKGLGLAAAGEAGTAAD